MEKAWRKLSIPLAQEDNDTLEVKIRHHPENREDGNMELATPLCVPKPTDMLTKSVVEKHRPGPNSVTSMSQGFHQAGIFSFSDGFDNQEPHIVQKSRRDKLRVQGFEPTGHGLVAVDEEEAGEVGMYEPTGGANMLLSEMFNFPTPVADLLANQISVPMRQPASVAGFSCSNRQGSNLSSIGDAAVLLKHHPDDEQHLIQGLNANDSAAAIQSQPRPQPQQHQRSPRLHHHQHPLAHAFHTSTASFGGAVVLQGQGQGLSLSLSSSWQPFELAKAEEELRARDIEVLYFNNPHHAPPPQQQQHHHLPSLHFQGQPSEGGQHVKMGYGPMGVVNVLRNSRYARPAQELLEEICSVGRGDFKARRIGKHHGTSNPNHSCGSVGGATTSVVGPSSSSKDLTPADKFEHHRNKAKLFSMLDEVDRRYNHYCDQMQMVVHSFDSVMGFVGAATPYTSLAQKAMSRHFRCLKDAIAAQLKQTCELLGENSSGSGITKGETPRLRLLDQSLRQQRAFHQMEQEAWHPQRGLPERSVTILRAWLFGHFLHPYPSDADKHLLARHRSIQESGLFYSSPSIKERSAFRKPMIDNTCGLVSNWFINARVRLWKPMVEEMYLQEAADSEEGSHQRAQSPTPPQQNHQPQGQGQGQRSENNAASASDRSTANHRFASNNTPLPLSMAGGSGGGNAGISRSETRVCPSEHGAVAGDDYEAAAGPGHIRFGATGDVSLTLGLRHAGNANGPEKSLFTVNFGG